MLHEKAADSTPEAPEWKRIFAASLRDPRELCRALELPESALAGAERGAALFPVVAPPRFVAKIRRGDLRDPLLRQILPLADEERDAPGELDDPVGDGEAQIARGLLQKHHGRALLIASGACAIHCRYCFRRLYPYDEAPRGRRAWEPALVALREARSIHEVILSGGDPLTLSDRSLAELASALAGIPHLRRLRVHSRLPVVIPERVDSALLGWLAGGRLKPVMVVHANHPRELDAASGAAFRRLLAAGVPVLNQAVLLRGVNDEVETLAELSERLIELGALPYYLHQLDRVRGASHFEVPVDRGRELLAELRRRLPGYAVPRYVQERPGAEHKLPLG